MGAGKGCSPSLRAPRSNSTRIADYARALETHDDVGAIMRVHQSNFRTVGFVQDVPVEALCELGVPVIDDVGSGWLAGQPMGDCYFVQRLTNDMRGRTDKEVAKEWVAEMSAAIRAVDQRHMITVGLACWEVPFGAGARSAFTC